MSIASKLVEYNDDDALLEAFMAYPEDGESRPAVLISHAWGGRDEFVEEKARALASLGYVGFALDMYGKNIRGSSREENAALMTPFLENRHMLQKRINSALEACAQQPEVISDRISAIGFCFGGLCVLDLARSGAEVRSVVSFHGLLGAPPKTQSQPIKAAVLVLHGHEDPMVSQEEIRQLEKDLTESGCDWQIHQYGQTMHAFTNPEAQDPDFGTVYSEKMNNRSWFSATQFLQETLGGLLS